MLEGICSTEERLLGAKFDDLTKVVCVEMSRYGSDNGIRFVSTYPCIEQKVKFPPRAKNDSAIDSVLRLTRDLVPLSSYHWAFHLYWMVGDNFLSYEFHFSRWRS